MAGAKTLGRRNSGTPGGAGSRLDSGQDPGAVSSAKTITQHDRTASGSPGGVPLQYRARAAGPGLAAWERISAIQFLKHKDHPLMSTVEQQVKAIVAEQLGVKQEQVTNDEIGRASCRERV